MKYNKILGLTLILFTLLTAVPVKQQAVALEKFILIATGSVTGAYYPVGSAICRMVNRFRRDHGIRCLSESTGGSASNIEALQNKQADLGIIQSDLEYDAYNGTGAFTGQTPKKDLRFLFSLYDEAFTVVVRADSNIKSIEDIKGSRVNIGSIGSGSRYMMELVMQIYGWTKKDFPELLELRTSEQADALCNNKIDVMVYSVGHPNTAVQEVTALCDTKIIPAINDKISNWIASMPYYITTSIPGGIYPGNPNDTTTFGVKSSLMTREDVDEETIYQIVKAVFSNFMIFKNLYPVFSKLDVKNMVHEGNIVPFHKGAERYYKEQKLLN